MPKRTRKSSPGKCPKKRSKGPLEPSPAEVIDQETASKADFGSLDDFCSQIRLAEVPLEEWSSVHNVLDLTVILFLTADEAVVGCCKEVRFSRSVAKSAEKDQAKQEREKCSRQVTVPCNASEGHRITVPGMGDLQNEVYGSLHIIIRIRT